MHACTVGSYSQFRSGTPKMRWAWDESRRICQRVKWRSPRLRSREPAASRGCRVPGAGCRRTDSPGSLATSRRSPVIFWSSWDSGTGHSERYRSCVLCVSRQARLLARALAKWSEPRGVGEPRWQTYEDSSGEIGYACRLQTRDRKLESTAKLRVT